MGSKSLFKVLKYILPFSFASKIKFTIQLLIILIYLCSLYFHYQYKFYFVVYQYLSKLSYNIIYSELYIGVLSVIATFFCAVNQKQYVKEVASLIRKNIISGEKGSWNLGEIVCYYKMISGTLIFAGLSIFNLAMLNWEDFAFFKMMLYLGLYIPHALLAYGIHFYCGNVVLLQMMCSQINSKLRLLHLFGKPKMYEKQPVCWSNRDNVCIQFDLHHIKLRLYRNIGRRICQCIRNRLWLINFLHRNTVTIQAPYSLGMKSIFHDDLTVLLHKYEIFQTMSKTLNKLFQIQISLILLHHFLVCLVCVHGLLKIVQHWTFIILPDDETTIRTNCQVFLFLVLNDFICIFLIGTIYKQEVIRFDMILSLNKPVVQCFSG